MTDNRLLYPRNISGFVEGPSDAGSARWKNGISSIIDRSLEMSSMRAWTERKKDPWLSSPQVELAVSFRLK